VELSNLVAAKAVAVDLALVLAVDCSSSVDEGDYRLQMDGIAAALRNPPLADAIAAGRFGQVAMTLLHWSSRKSQKVVVDWRVLASQTDLEAFAHDTEHVKRQWQPGGTGLAAAIVFSVALLETLPFLAERRLIDVSGDGEDNDGGNAGLARNAAVARGITINGLPIISGSQSLQAYYDREVIGGTDSFLMPTENMLTFGDAMKRKLLREVAQLNA
jgi:Protein of unknown function (DUF1194)